MATTQTLPSGSATSTPAANHALSPSLFVGDLPLDVSESVLYEIFNKVGAVASIRICKHTITRSSLGYGYVNYQNYHDAEVALDTLNYYPVNGGQIRVMWCVRDPRLRRSGDGNIFVKNLDRSIDNKFLHDKFSLFGNILSCKVAVDSEGMSKGFGFVHYDSDESAAKAIQEMNNTMLKDSRIYVGVFKKRSERASESEAKYTNVYVKHFPNSWSEAKLEEVFKVFGPITSMLIRTSNKQQRFAFINFETTDGAKAAVEELNGRVVRDDVLLSEEESLNLNEDDGSEEAGEVRLYVAPHQLKAQRHAMLKAKHSSNASVNGDAHIKATGANLYIKNFDESIDDTALLSMFSVFGPISSAKVMRNEKNEPLGFGFVSFVSAEDATKAVTEMHSKVINGKPLYVSAHEPKEERRRRLGQQFTQASVRPPIGGVAQPVVPFSGVPPVPYGGHPTMGFPPRPVVTAFNHSIMPWRNVPAGAFPQQSMRPPMNLYPSVALSPGIPDQNQPTQMNGPMNRGIRGNPRNGGVQYSSVMPPGAKQIIPNVNKGYLNNFKFTSQARNQMEPHPAQLAPQMHDQAMVNTETPLTLSYLTSLPTQAQKQLLGEKLFPRIAKFQAALAGKVTGMMLEMENEELLHLLSDDAQLKTKVDEACKVLEEHKPAAMS